MWKYDIIYSYLWCCALLPTFCIIKSQQYEMKNHIDTLLTKSGLNKNFRKLLRKIPILVEEVNKMKLEGFQDDIEILYRLYNDITVQPVCEVCKTKQISFKGWGGGYLGRHCGPICARRNPKTQEKLRKTVMEKYGVKTVFMRQDVRDQGIATRKTTEYKDKMIPVWTDKDVKAKRAATTKNTLLEKYGVEYIGQVEEFKATRKENTQNNRMSGNFAERSKNKRAADILDIFNDKKIKFEETMNVKILDDASAYTNIGSLINMQCNTCNTLFKSSFHNRNYTACIKCVPHNRSKLETEVFKFCLSLLDTNKTINAVQSCRSLVKGKEVDMYFSDFNLAIEVNGLYWHSERFIDKSYHKEKTELVTATGTRLMQIFSDEWFHKQDIVKSMITSAFGFTQKLYARKCIVKEISYADSKHFLEINHMQGTAKSSYNLGLYHNDELMSVMTFAKPRFNKKYDWELLRFASKLNTTVVGGASKLFTHFVNTKLDDGLIISYCDLRLGTGMVYEKIGMKRIGVTTPNYFWLDPSYSVRHNRMKFQKHKLKSFMGDKFDESKTEIVNMHNYGYFRTWDCGNSIFEYSR